MKRTFTDQIRKAIDDCDLSRYEICKRARVDQAVMSRFMNHKMFMEESTLNALAGVVGLHVVVSPTKQVKNVDGKKTK